MTNSTMPFFGTAMRAPLSSVLAFEQENNLSRETVTLAADAGDDLTCELGTVLGRRLFGTPVGAAKAGNTGNGALSALALGAEAKIGTYNLVCIAAATNAGRFQVLDPDGIGLADLLVGVAYASPQIGCSLADGANDFAIGDTFTVTVPAGDGKCTALNLTATNGTQLADSVLIGAKTVPAGVDTPAVAVVRLAGVVGANLIWPAGITDAQKAAALARLASKTILTRQVA